MKWKNYHKILIILFGVLLCSEFNALETSSQKTEKERDVFLGLSLDYSIGPNLNKDRRVGRIVSGIENIQSLSGGIYLTWQIPYMKLFLNPAYKVSEYSAVFMFFGRGDHAYTQSFQITGGLLIPGRYFFIKGKSIDELNVHILLAPVIQHQFWGRYYPNRTISSTPTSFRLPEKDLISPGYGGVVAVNLKPGFCKSNPGCSFTVGFSILQDIFKNYFWHFVYGVRYGYDI